MKPFAVALGFSLTCLALADTWAPITGEGGSFRVLMPAKTITRQMSSQSTGTFNLSSRSYICPAGSTRCVATEFTPPSGIDPREMDKLITSIEAGFLNVLNNPTAPGTNLTVGALKGRYTRIVARDRTVGIWIVEAKGRLFALTCSAKSTDYEGVFDKFVGNFHANMR